MHRKTSFSWQLTALMLLTLGLGLLLLPDEYSDIARRLARDLGRPGQAVTMSAAAACQDGWRIAQDWRARRSDLEQLRIDLRREQDRTAQFQLWLGQVQRQWHDAQRKLSGPVSSRQSAALFIPELIEARVLGRETLTLHQGRQILGVGSSGGVGENLLVLDPAHPTLDIGRDLGVAVHSPVFAGQAVVGRTVNCGAYTCCLQSVSDAKFSGAAQIMRRTSSGLQPGPEGVVEGTGGTRCRLTGIWRREPIEVGDEVYTPLDDPLLPYQMCYGKVIRAELPEGTAHWIIELEPVATSRPLSHVQVLIPKENPIRILAN